MSDVLEGSGVSSMSDDGKGVLYSAVQCIMGNSHMRTPPMDSMTDWRTDTYENITFSQLRWRAVRKELC